MKLFYRRALIPGLVLTLSQDAALAAGLRHAYLDRMQRVHVVTQEGHDLCVSSARAWRLTVAPNRNAVAWLVIPKDGGTDSTELRVFSKGRVRRIDCAPLVDEFRFRQGGRQIAVRCAGKHFAGKQELYDTASMEMTDGFDEASKPLRRRPRWSLDND